MSRSKRRTVHLIALTAFLFLALDLSLGAKADQHSQDQATVTAVERLPVATMGNQDEQNAASPSPYDTFPTSLHATRRGKVTWYSAENGGFETLTGIPIEQLTCLKCHPTIPPEQYEPSCNDCHQKIGDPVPDQTCLSCHGRQALEIKFGFSDVHRDAGFQCRDCHTSREMHGDGIEYSSWLAPGAMDVKCENCHIQEATRNEAHIIHFSSVDCTACHTQSIITCYNCHFESEVAGNRKRPFGILRDWIFLLRREETGKVHASNLMTMTYQGKTFYTLAPYRAHTISRTARDCDDCHNSPALREYLETGKITVTRWDDQSRQLIQTPGVIPIPPDWQQALQIDFLDYLGDPTAPETDPQLWEFLKTGADRTQILFAQPLTSDQIRKLQMFGR